MEESWVVRDGMGSKSWLMAIRLLKRDDNTVLWFRVMLPKDLLPSQASCCVLHSHDDDINNFYRQYVDFSVQDLHSCKYPLIHTRCACIGSTVYFVGGDRDMDGDVRIINSEMIGAPITQRPVNYVPPVCFKNNLSHRIGKDEVFFNVNMDLHNAPQLVCSKNNLSHRIGKDEVFFNVNMDLHNAPQLVCSKNNLSHRIGKDEVFFNVNMDLHNAPQLVCSKNNLSHRIGKDEVFFNVNMDLHNAPQLVCSKNNLSHRIGKDEVFFNVNMDLHNAPQLVCSKNNLSHRIGKDEVFFNVNMDLHNAPQLVSPRFRPRLVTVGGKLFLFGGNLPPPPHDPHYYVPFAEVFDPQTGLCSPIKDPPFPNRIGNSILFLAPFLSKIGEQNILVMSHLPASDIIALYNVDTDSWDSFSDPERILFRNTLSILGNPIPVANQDSIYWLRDFGHTGLICSYNWKTKHFWKGPFIGLQHELPFLCFKESPMILLHIQQDLFYLVWTDFQTTSDTDDIYELGTHTHFTLLRVSREDPPSEHLSAFVVGCASYVLPMSNYTLLSGYCLEQA